MVVLAWIGQVLLFFIFWKALHLITVEVRNRLKSVSFLWELAVNVVLSIVLLIVFNHVSSVWWLMILTGAVVGVVTGQMASRKSG